MSIVQYRYNDFLKQNEYNVGISISCPSLGHCGIVLKEENSQTGYYIHFNVDGIEVKDLPAYSDNFCLGLERYKTTLASDQTQLQPMLELCKFFRENRQKIGYSFNYKGGKFDLTFGTPDTNIRGLTCATFVIAFLRTFNINIVDVESWPILETEFETMRSYLQIVYKDELQEKYPDNVEEKLKEIIDNQLPCSRFLPRQIISSSPIEDDEPAPFIYCDALGRCISCLCPTKKKDNVVH